MEGYPSIGTLYFLKYEACDLLWAVIENNANNQTSTLVVVEKGPKLGKRVEVNVHWLNERAPLGPIIKPEGELVIENGIEFVKTAQERVSRKR